MFVKNPTGPELMSPLLELPRPPRGQPENVLSLPLCFLLPSGARFLALLRGFGRPLSVPSVFFSTPEAAQEKAGGGLAWLPSAVSPVPSAFQSSQRLLLSLTSSPRGQERCGPGDSAARSRGTKNQPARLTDIASGRLPPCCRASSGCTGIHGVGLRHSGECLAGRCKALGSLPAPKRKEQ